MRFRVLRVSFDGFLQLFDGSLISVILEVPDGKLVAHLRLIGIPLGTRSAPRDHQQRDASTHCEQESFQTAYGFFAFSKHSR